MRRLGTIAALVCLAAVCLPACGVPSDSTAGHSTDRVERCEQPSDCESGQRCVVGVCRPNCQTDAACQPDQRCVAGGCLETCEDGGCPSGTRCTYGNLCWDEEAAVRPCDRTADCPFGEYCAESRCRSAACETDADCLGPNICSSSSGECRRGCRTGREVPQRLRCGPGERCNSSHVCLEEACRPGECGPYRRCSDARSPAACVYTGACGDEGGADPEAVCDAYAAQRDADVQLTCVSGQCEIPSCDSDEDCAAGEICEHRAGAPNRCRPGCRCTDRTEDADCSRGCPFGSFCDDEAGADGQSPSYRCLESSCDQTGCSSGEACLSNGTCKATCADNAACADGEICAGDPRICRLCRPFKESGGALQCGGTAICDTSLKPSAKGYGLCVERASCPSDRFDPHHCRSDAASLTPSVEELPAAWTATFCAENTSGSGSDCTRKSGEWYRLETPSGGDLTVTVSYPEQARDAVGRVVQSGNLGVALSDSNADTLDESNTPASGAEDDNGTEQVGINVSKGETYYIHVYGELAEKVSSVSYEIEIAIR